MLGKSLGNQKDCISIMGLICLRQDFDIVKKKLQRCNEQEY